MRSTLRNSRNKLFTIVFTIFLSISFGQSNDTISFFFAFDSSIPIIDSEVQEAIREQLDTAYRIKVSAYTDTVGDSQYNSFLALRRANSIIRELSLAQLKPEVNIHGETSSFGSDAANRRVDLVIEKKKTDTLILDIQFLNREDVIVPGSYPELKRLIEYLDQHDFQKIELHGHVCCTGHYELSLARAKTIERELIKAGIDASKISCFGHSNHKPRYPETNPANEAKNRRVEVVILH